MKFFLEIYKTKTREGDSKDHRENDHLIPKVFEINSLIPQLLSMLNNFSNLS